MTGRRRSMRAAPLALLWVLGCPAQRPAVATDPADAWQQVSRRLKADPADGLATLEAARLALFVRNDARQADLLAADAARAPALTADGNLLRTYLAWRRRDYAAVLDRAPAVVEADPRHDRAEVALWLLEWIARDHPDFDRRIGPWLEELVSGGGVSPGARRVAGRILLRVRAVAKDLEGYDRVMADTTGAVTRARSACPFGLFPALDFDRPQAPEAHPGPLRTEYRLEGPAPRRTVTAVDAFYRDAWLRCPDWPEDGGVVFHEADLRVDAAVDAVVTAWGGGSWRVTVDGIGALERDGLRAQLPEMRSATVRLEAGWHRVRMKAATATGALDAWITVTDADGEPVGQATWPDEARPLAGASVQEAAVEGAADRLLDRAGHASLGAAIEALVYAAYMLHAYPHGDPARAREAAGRALALAPGSADAMYVLGEATEADDTLPVKWRGSRSRSLQQRIAGLDPDHLLARYSLGFLALREGRPEVALEHLDRTVALNPDYYWGHFRRFEVLRDLGWDREAREALERAVALAPNPVVLEDAVQWYDGRGDIARREELNGRLEERMADPAPRLPADRAIDRGDRAAAVAAWRARADTRPWDDGPWRALAELAGDAAALDEAARRRPRDPRRWSERADIMGASGRTELAATELATRLHDEPGRLTDRRLQALLAGVELYDPAPSDRDARALRAEYDAAVASDPALAAWPGHEAVYLLDHRRDELWGDGGGYRESHRITLLQTKEAVDEVGEWRAPDGAVMLEMRTLKADGGTLEPELGQQKGDLSFSGASPGDAVEVRYLQPLTPDYPGGGWHDTYYLRFNSRPVWRAELSVSVPAGERLAVTLRAGASAPEEALAEGGARRTYRWRARAVSPLETEPYQAPYAEWLAHVVYAYRAEGLDGRRRDQLLDRLVQGVSVTPAVRAEAAAICAGLPVGASVTERAAALYAWVRDHVEADGPLGRFTGPAAPAILTARRGDRTLALSALLHAAGIEHRVLVARPLDQPLEDPPTPVLAYYSSPVIEVPPAAPAGAPLLLPMAGDHGRPGALPDDLRGAQALLVEDGPVTTRTLPAEGGDAWRVTARLAADPGGGALAGEVVVESRGQTTAALRGVLPRMPVAQRRRVVERALAPALPGLSLEDLTTSDLEDPGAPLRLVLRVRVAGVLEPGARPGLVRLHDLFAVPVSALLGDGTPPGRYLQRAERRQPLLTRPLHEDLDVTLSFKDAGAALQIEGAPPTVDLAGPWGSVAQSWQLGSATPGTARLNRRLDLGIRRVPVEGLGEFSSAMAAIDRALSAEVRFRTAPADAP